MRCGTSIDAHIAHINKQRREFVRLDVPEAVAVFWERGTARNQERATLAARGDPARRHYRIDETPAGAYIESQNLPHRDEENLRARVHLNMAAAARGNVETFVAGAAPDSLFRNGTMQMLFDNPGVTHINGIEKDILAGRSPGDTFKNVWASELIRDHQRGEIASVERPGALYYGAAADARLNPPPPGFADPYRTPQEVCDRVQPVRDKIQQREIEKRQREREERDRARQRSRSDGWDER